MPALYTLDEAAELLGRKGSAKAYTLQGAADAIGVKLWTIRQAVNRGELRKVYPGTKTPLIRASDLDEYLASLPETAPD